MLTITTIQEGEKEEKGEAREEMPVEFPQQLLFVDGIRTALVRRAIRVGLVDLSLFFLAGHGCGERKMRGGKKCGASQGCYICTVRGREVAIDRHSPRRTSRETACRDKLIRIPFSRPSDLEVRFSPFGEPQ